MVDVTTKKLFQVIIVKKSTLEQTFVLFLVFLNRSRKKKEKKVTFSI